MRALALNVDVDTLMGTQQGVPRLVELFRQKNVGATFLFSLGPDHTGRAIKRVFRKGFLQKVRRTNVTAHYGFKTLMYGTLLPGPDIGARCRSELHAVRDAGFECGVHCWDHVTWQDGVRNADAVWTQNHVQRAFDRFGDIFGTHPKVHGAAGWQMNVHALRALQAQGFTHQSDGRGRSPFVPLVRAEPIRVAQFPTTLPTLDELIGVGTVTSSNVDQHVLTLTEPPSQHPHVFTLHAELEGLQLLDVMTRLIDGWHAQGYALVSLGQLATRFALDALPRCETVYGEVPGRSGELMLQGAAYADVAAAPPLTLSK